jgi:hypothetical protein
LRLQFVCFVAFFSDLEAGKLVEAFWTAIIPMASRRPMEDWGAKESDKRQRLSDPDAAFILHKGMVLMNRENKGSLQTASRRFHEVFGCSIPVAVEVWKRVDPWSCVSKDATVEHLLWALMFLKLYAKESTLSTLAGGVDEKTFRKWNWMFIGAISGLESVTVRILLIVVIVATLV